MSSALLDDQFRFRFEGTYRSTLVPSSTWGHVSVVLFQLLEARTDVASPLNTTFACLTDTVVAAGTAPEASQLEQDATTGRTLWFVLRSFLLGHRFWSGRGRKRFHDEIL